MKAQPIPGIGDPLPPFTLLPFRGNQAVGYQPGRVSVISFCALWCDTWKDQSARLRAVRRNLTGLPVSYYAISVDGRWAERFANGNSADTDVLLDSGGRLSQSLGVRAVPWTFVVDSAGIIQFSRQGIVREGELEPLLRRLISGKPATSSPQTASVFLTFDDFPTVRDGEPLSEDEDLLDILRAAHVPATFFCIGKHLTEPAGERVARRAAREGHALQMHSWSHDAAHPDLPRCSRTIGTLTGKAPTLYRPPGSSDLYRPDGRTPVTPIRRVLNPYDYQRPGTPELSRRILSAIAPGMVILLHAGVRETRDVLPELLDSLRRRNILPALL
ncbi:MAG: polysaccharide deacetylase family protein [Armatimonas sp.]